MQDDLIDAVDWAVAQGIADPARVAIMGTSYGGYSALVGVTFTPEKFPCAVDLVGISNLVTFLNTIPDYWQTWKSIWAVRVGDYKSEEDGSFARGALAAQPRRPDRAAAPDRPRRERRARQGRGVRADRRRHATSRHSGHLRLLSGRRARIGTIRIAGPSPPSRKPSLLSILADADSRSATISTVQLSRSGQVATLSPQTRDD